PGRLVEGVGSKDRSVPVRVDPRHLDLLVALLVEAHDLVNDAGAAVAAGTILRRPVPASAPAERPTRRACRADVGLDGVPAVRPPRAERPVGAEDVELVGGVAGARLDAGEHPPAAVDLGDGGVDGEDVLDERRLLLPVEREAPRLVDLDRAPGSAL